MEKWKITHNFLFKYIPTLRGFYHKKAHMRNQVIIRMARDRGKGEVVNERRTKWKFCWVIIWETFDFLLVKAGKFLAHKKS